jgi:hypothetical protein
MQTIDAACIVATHRARAGRGNSRLIVDPRRLCVESATVGDLLELQALGLFNDPREGFVGFRTTKPFDTVQLDLGQLATLLGSLDVFSACVSLQ